MYNLVKAFKALSDDTRLRIINVLLVRECCVCEIVQALKISQTRASRNLTMLHDAGFLRLKKDGLWSIYSVARDPEARYLLKLVESAELALAKNEIALADRKRLITASRSGISCIQKTERDTSTSQNN